MHPALRLMVPVLFGLALVACGDDESGSLDAASEVAEVLFPDTSFPDTTFPDTTPADTSAADTTPADTSAADTTPADTLAADTTPADTAPPDTTPADTAPPDTTPADTTPDTTDTSAADTTPGPTCLSLAADHRRHVVVARPYSEPDGERSMRWQVLPIAPDGTLAKPASEIMLGRASDGTVAFRADGALGVTAHEDGTIGVFALDATGHATVLEERLDTGAYVHEVHVLADRLLLVDGNWQNNGGGIYQAPLGCDGSVGPATLLYPTKLAESLVIDGDRHLVAAKEAVTTDHGTLHLVAPEPGGWTRLTGADLFPDDEAILSALAITSDGRFALVGDNQFFAPVDNRVGVAALAEGTISAVDVVSPLEDPVALVASPYDDAILVVSGFGDAVRVLSYDRDRDPPFVDEGEPLYVTSRPALPGNAVLVGGAFPDLVFVAENQAIRRFRFAGGGAVNDLGPTAIGDSYEAIPGAIGVQP